MDSSFLKLLPLATSDSDREEEELLPLILATTIVHASNDDHRWSVQQHRARHGYQNRPQLLPNPLGDTPWAVLYQSHSDSTYLGTMGLNIVASEAILDASFSRQWYSMPLHRPDATPTATVLTPNVIQIRVGRGGPRRIYKTLELIRKNIGSHSIFVLQLG